MYGYKCWTVRNKDWKDLKRSLADKHRVLEKADVTSGLSNTSKRRKLWVFGPLVRKEEDCIEKMITEGFVEGRRKERQKSSFFIH